MQEVMEVTKWPDVPSWEKLVKASDEATFFHTPMWHEIVVQTYKEYSIATRQFTFDDGREAVFPLIQTKEGGILKGKARLKSSVFGVYGGIVSDNKLLQDQQNQIYRHLTGIKGSLSVNSNPFSEYVLPDHFTRKDGFTQVFLLQHEEDSHYRRLSRGAKSNLNQAGKMGVTVRTARTEKEISTYYTIYQDTLRRWGDATLLKYPEELFLNIFKIAGDSAKIWLAEKDGKIIAGAVIFYWNNIVLYWHGVALQDYFSCYPNNMLHMEIIKDATAKGYRYYDFGPSGGQEGVVWFKKSFGAEKREFVAGRWKYRLIKRV
jgi:hypothetical protein